MEFRIWGLNYSEFMQFHQLEDSDETFSRYYKFGGLPYLVNLPFDEGIVSEYLRGIYNTWLLYTSGVGIQFYKDLDTVTVVKVVPGGPSEKAGIKDGDRIVRVNDSLVAGVKMGQDKIQELMRGELGTKVELTIARRGEPKLIKKEVVRGSIPVKSVDVAYMLNDTCLLYTSRCV